MARLLSAFVLFLAVIYNVNCHTSHMGTCPFIPPVENFDIDRFLGNWYAVQKTLPRAPCVTYHIAGTDEDKKSIVTEYSELAENRYKYKFSGLLRAVVPDHPGKLLMTWPKSVKSYRYHVFSTDYDHYAGVFICQNFGVFHRRSILLLSRERTLDEHFVNEMLSKLHLHSIDIEGLDVIDQVSCLQNHSLHHEVHIPVTEVPHIPISESTIQVVTDFPHVGVDESVPTITDNNPNLYNEGIDVGTVTSGGNQETAVNAPIATPAAEGAVEVIVPVSEATADNINLTPVEEQNQEPVVNPDTVVHIQIDANVVKHQESDHDTESVMADDPKIYMEGGESFHDEHFPNEHEHFIGCGHELHEHNTDHDHDVQTQQVNHFTDEQYQHSSYHDSQKPISVQIPTGDLQGITNHYNDDLQIQMKDKTVQEIPDSTNQDHFDVQHQKSVQESGSEYQQQQEIHIPTTNPQGITITNHGIDQYLQETQKVHTGNEQEITSGNGHVVHIPHGANIEIGTNQHIPTNAATTANGQGELTNENNFNVQIPIGQQTADQANLDFAGTADGVQSTIHYDEDAFNEYIRRQEKIAEEIQLFAQNLGKGSEDTQTNIGPGQSGQFDQTQVPASENLQGSTDQISLSNMNFAGAGSDVQTAVGINENLGEGNPINQVNPNTAPITHIHQTQISSGIPTQDQQVLQPENAGDSLETIVLITPNESPQVGTDKIIASNSHIPNENVGQVHITEDAGVSGVVPISGNEELLIPQVQQHETVVATVQNEVDSGIHHQIPENSDVQISGNEQLFTPEVQQPETVIPTGKSKLDSGVPDLIAETSGSQIPVGQGHVHGAPPSHPHFPSFGHGHSHKHGSSHGFPHPYPAVPDHSHAHNHVHNHQQSHGHGHSHEGVPYPTPPHYPQYPPYYPPPPHYSPPHFPPPHFPPPFYPPPHYPLPHYPPPHFPSHTGHHNTGFPHPHYPMPTITHSHHGKPHIGNHETSPVPDSASEGYDLDTRIELRNQHTSTPVKH